MEIDALVALRAREVKRVAESARSSPEWDAAVAAVEDLDEQLRDRAGDVADAAKPTLRSTDGGICHDDV
jgi:hypothetical protein